MQNNNSGANLKIRYRLPDTVRGICVMGMILYHTLFDVIYFFNLEVPQGLLFFVNVIRDAGAALFILLSGFTFSLGRHHLRRGLILTGAGAVITVATRFVMPEAFIIFGILSFMGIACLIMIPAERVLRRVPSVAGLLISLLIFLFLFECNYGYCGLYGIQLFLFPRILYRNYLTAFIGFPFEGFVSGDYFGIFPWIFVYFAGYFIFRIVKRSENADKILFFGIPFLEKTGRYSLYIYLIHQPVIYLIVMLFSRLLL